MRKRRLKAVGQLTQFSPFDVGFFVDFVLTIHFITTTGGFSGLFQQNVLCDLFANRRLKKPSPA